MNRFVTEPAKLLLTCMCFVCCSDNRNGIEIEIDMDDAASVAVDGDCTGAPSFRQDGSTGAGRPRRDVHVTLTGAGLQQDHQQTVRTQSAAGCRQGTRDF